MAVRILPMTRERMHEMYRGYGTQAERLAIEYAFDVLGAESIFAESLVKNKGHES